MVKFPSSWKTSFARNRFGEPIWLAFAPNGHGLSVLVDGENTFGVAEIGFSGATPGNYDIVKHHVEIDDAGLSKLVSVIEAKKRIAAYHGESPVFFDRAGAVTVEYIESGKADGRE